MISAANGRKIDFLILKCTHLMRLLSYPKIRKLHKYKAHTGFSRRFSIQQSSFLLIRLKHERIQVEASSYRIQHSSFLNEGEFGSNSIQFEITEMLNFSEDPKDVKLIKRDESTKKNNFDNVCNMYFY